MLKADAGARESAWAWARRGGARMLAYSGIAMAARIPMMATTIISSMSVKPRWLPSIFRFLCQKLSIFYFPFVWLLTWLVTGHFGQPDQCGARSMPWGKCQEYRRLDSGSDGGSIASLTNPVRSPPSIVT